MAEIRIRKRIADTYGPGPKNSHFIKLLYQARKKFHRCLHHEFSGAAAMVYISVKFVILVLIQVRLLGISHHI